MILELLLDLEAFKEDELSTFPHYTALMPAVAYH